MYRKYQIEHCLMPANTFYNHLQTVRRLLTLQRPTFPGKKVFYLKGISSFFLFGRDQI